MDILRQTLAPISDMAWEELNQQARRALKNFLSARSFVEVEGPYGWAHGAIPTGRLAIAEELVVEGVRYGHRVSQPLVEARAGFTLNRWELDNISRGLETPDLSTMEEAARAIATFEERAIYCGLAEGEIPGLQASSEHKAMVFGDSPEEVLAAVTRGIALFHERGVGGPYSLIVGPERWRALAVYVSGYPVNRHLERIIGGSIILSPCVEQCVLVSERGGDFRLTLGQDVSIGYEGHRNDEIDLYFTESFAFQVFDPAAVLLFE